MKLTPFFLLWCSCGSFDFVVDVAHVDADTLVLVDGAVQDPMANGGISRVVVSVTFGDYSDGSQWPGFNVQLVQSGVTTYEETLKPGYCARYTSERNWDSETLFVSTEPQYLGLAGYVCEGPSGRVEGVFD